MGTDLLSRPHLARRSVDLRRVRKQRLFQPLVDNALLLDVVKSEDRETNDSEKQDDGD